MFVAWKQASKTRSYPYLQYGIYDRETQASKTVNVYLGPPDLSKARDILTEIIDDPAQVEELLNRLEAARPAGTDEANAARALERIAKRFPDSQRVQAAVRAALAVLQTGGSSRTSVPGAP